MTEPFHCNYCGYVCDTWEQLLEHCDVNQHPLNFHKSGGDELPSTYLSCTTSVQVFLDSHADIFLVLQASRYS